MVNNLRWCTSSENQRNRTPNKDNTSGIKAVDKFRNSWRAVWKDNNNKRCSKRFSIVQYGDVEAKTLAIEWRKAKEVEFGYL